jgi:hypothetical protein
VVDAASGSYLTVTGARYTAVVASSQRVAARWLTLLMRSYALTSADDEHGPHDAGVGSGMGPLGDSEPRRIDVAPGDASGRLLHGIVTQAERVITIHTRIKNTATCIFIYLVLLVLNVFVMWWELSGRGYNIVIILLEFLINLFIVVEVLIGVYGLGREYFRQWMNLVDFGLACLCVGSFVFLVVAETQGDVEYLSEVDAILLAARFLFQLLRMSMLVYRSRQVAMMQVQEEVDFNAISLEACIDADAGSRRARMRADESDGFGLESPQDGSIEMVAPVPTSHLHLKPSIYLELQNAKAFQEDGAASPIVREATTGNGNGYHSQQQAQHATNGYLVQPHVPIGFRSPVPLLDPPQPSSNQSSTPSSSSAASSAHSSGCFTRSLELHPRLAHDSEMEDEMELSQHISGALDAEQRHDLINTTTDHHDDATHRAEERRGLI